MQGVGGGTNTNPWDICAIAKTCVSFNQVIDQLLGCGVTINLIIFKIPMRENVLW
jgi:hypothetical protein